MSRDAPGLVYFPKLRRKIDEPQVGVMKVGSQILDLLSKGIYSAPENALKELISNSYDAEATRVVIKFSPGQNRLEVRDDGDGMDYNDFDQHFAFISRSEKRDQGEFTKRFGRPIIGKIGIGFIAVSELCDKIRVLSAKRGSDSWFEAEIDFKPFKAPEAKKKEFYEVSQYVLTNHVKEDPDEHYTIVFLEGLTAQLRDILENRTPEEVQTYDMPRDDFEKVLEKLDELTTKRTLNLRRDFGPFWSFLLSLANMIPVPYADGSPIRVRNKATDAIDAISKDLNKYNFSVVFDGLSLRKPTRFPYPERETISREGEDFDVFPIAYLHTFRDGSNLRLAGYIYNQRKQTPIEEWRGIVIRIRNVSVGGPDPGFLAYPYPGEKLFFPWTYGELYVQEGLEDAMNIDRSSFKLGHPHYRRLRSYLHDTLHSQVFRRARDRYARRMETRGKVEKAARERNRQNVLEKAFGKRLDITSTHRASKKAVELVPQEARLTFYTAHPLFQGLRKGEREMLKDVLIALEASLPFAVRDAEKIRQRFWRNLHRLIHQNSE